MLKSNRFMAERMKHTWSCIIVVPVSCVTWLFFKALVLCLGVVNEAYTPVACLVFCGTFLFCFHLMTRLQ